MNSKPTPECVIEKMRNGATLQEIAWDFGVTRERIRQVAANHRHYELVRDPSRREREIRDSIFADAHSGGESMRSIANRFGLNPATVSAGIKRHRQRKGDS